MLAININLRECLAQSISLSLAFFVRHCQRLGAANPIQDPQPSRRDQITQPVERAGEEAVKMHGSV
jgi:hypothetical protein